MTIYDFLDKHYLDFAAIIVWLLVLLTWKISKGK